MSDTSNIITIEEYNKFNSYIPVIIPEGFIDKFKQELPNESIEALKEGKVVFISGYWCILSNRLETRNGKYCPTCHADLPPNHPLR